MHADDGHIKLQGRVVLALQNGQVEQVRSAILKTDWNKMEQVTLQVIFFLLCLLRIYSPVIQGISHGWLLSIYYTIYTSMKLLS